MCANIQKSSSWITLSKEWSRTSVTYTLCNCTLYEVADCSKVSFNKKRRQQQKQNYLEFDLCFATLSTMKVAWVQSLVLGRMPHTLFQNHVVHASTASINKLHTRKKCEATAHKYSHFRQMSYNLVSRDWTQKGCKVYCEATAHNNCHLRPCHVMSRRD